MVYQGEDLSRILYKFNDSDFSISRFEDLRVEDVGDDTHVTPNSILEDPLRGYGGSGYPNNNNSGSKKKGGFLPGIMLSFSSRRKGAPQRSPLS